jgi:hypothetical protein
MTSAAVQPAATVPAKPAVPVPVANGVLGPQAQSLPALAGTAPHETLLGGPQCLTTQHLMLCHVDGAECDVLAAIMPALTGVCTDEAQLAQSLSAARRWMPCGRCRAATAAAQRLPGTRLGHRERDILLRAPTEQAEVLCAATDTRAGKEAKLRAARKLSRAGLVWTGKEDAEGSRRDRKRGKWAYFKGGTNYYYRDDLTDRLRVRVVTARLTPLGAEIRERYLAELTDGRPIRWDGRVADAAAAARHDVDGLLAALEQEMRDYAAWGLGLVALIAQANPTGAKPYQNEYAAADRVSRAIKQLAEAAPSTRSTP